MTNAVKRLRVERGLSQAQLGEMIGTTGQYIGKIERGDRGVSKALAVKLSRALGVEPAELVFAQYVERYDDPPAARSGASDNNQAPYRAPDADPSRVITDGLAGEKDLPVYAAAEGGPDGHLIVTYDAIDYVRRPSPLENVRTGYAMYVVGDSMEPAYEQGDLLLVHGSMPPQRGDDVVLIRQDRDNQAYVLVKRLVRWSGDAWTVRQHNPPEDFDLPRADWRQVHVIVGKYSRR